MCLCMTVLHALDAVTLLGGSGYVTVGTRLQMTDRRSH
jgi:hypothetical protein